MNRETISHLAHTHHPIAAPLGDGAVARLLDRALARGTERVLDLGCGPGEWLLRALRDRPGVHGVGVDVSGTALDRAAGAAQALGVADRLSLHRRPAADHTDPHPYDLVLSVGAAHAFGGLPATLDAARAHLAPGGHALVGDGYWEHPPTPADLDTFGRLPDLPTFVDQVTAAGWTPVYGHLSTREERDDYEWSWTGSLAAWALDHPDHPDSAEALDAANGHRAAWLRGYRATWGFATLLLRRTAD